jgi:hypothetical protein
MGRRPFRGEKANRPVRKALRSQGCLWVTMNTCRKGCEGSLGERDTQRQRWIEGEPKRPEDPREQRPRPGLNLRVRRGARLATWDEAVEAPATSRRVCWESARAEEELETAHSITTLEESFEGRSPGALEAERGFQGLCELTPLKG